MLSCDKIEKLHWVVTALFFVAIAVFIGFTLTGGWDIWWHMLVGRIFLADGLSALNVDMLSHTTEQARWLHKDLLADVILYKGFNTFGFAWFAVLKGLVVIAVAYGTHLMAPAGKRRITITILMGGLAVAAIQYRLVERPILFSLAFLPLLTAMLESARRRSFSTFNLRKAIFTWLPPILIVWLWAWLHRGAIVGLALILAYGMEQWAGLLLGKTGWKLFGLNRHVGHAIAALVAFAVGAGLSLINPSGIHFYTSSFAVVGSETLRNMISDWAPIEITDLVKHFPITCVLSLSAFTGIMWNLFSKRRSDGDIGAGPMHASLIAVFAWLLLFDSIRWTPQLSLFSAAILADLLHRNKAKIVELLPNVLTLARGRNTLLAVAVGTLIILNSSFSFGVGEVPNKFPDGAVNFARTHGLSGKVINSFHLGGYILWKMWPEVLVTSDGRNDLVYSPKLLTSLLRSQSNPQLFDLLAEKTGTKWVIASNVPSHLGYSFLFKHPDWMMVYWSEAAVIYLKRSMFPQPKYPALWKNEYKLINPSAVDVSVIRVIDETKRNNGTLKQLTKEIDNMLSCAPDGLRSNVALAVYFHFMGPHHHHSRDRVMQKLKKLYGHKDVVKQLAERFSSTTPKK